MAKTQDELNALKEKVAAIEDELKALSDEELEQVTGGDGIKQNEDAMRRRVHKRPNQEIQPLHENENYVFITKK